MKRTSLFGSLLSVFALMYFLMFQPAFASAIVPSIVMTPAVTVSHSMRWQASDGVVVAVIAETVAHTYKTAVLNMTKHSGTRMNSGPGSSFAATVHTGRRFARSLALLRSRYRQSTVNVYRVDATDPLLKWRLTKA